MAKVEVEREEHDVAEYQRKRRHLARFSGKKLPEETLCVQ